MIRGLYIAGSGMLAESLRNDVIANNMANVNTTGYKKDVAVSKDFASLLIRRINDGPQQPNVGTLGIGSVINEIAPIHTQGNMRPTGNDLDLAVMGKGFFTIQTPNGVRYTRNGNFDLNRQGQLVTTEGYRVLGQRGPIQIGTGKATINSQGQVFVNGQLRDRLQLVEFQNERLELTKEGDTLYSPNGQAAPRLATGQVKQGILESSNVNIVREMVDLISGYRAYEISGKAVQTQDQLLEKAVTEVGRT